MDKAVALSLEQFNEVQGWTDEEWVQVLKNIPRGADVEFGIEFVRKLRNERRASVTSDDIQTGEPSG